MSTSSSLAIASPCPSDPSAIRRGAALLSQVALDGFELLRQRQDVELRAHAREQLVAAHRLREELAHAGLDTLEPRVDVVAAREEDDREALALVGLPECGADL